ncbi:hypothetical protein PV08_05144 [Exophiala spinifera]|uniref:Xylanolytic transcriptional activator regulatory domain-containing protein n=1 Tax=Exophiala spinifera TaxID=91928 RepID=A0A0D2C2W4_9EURO|nr:uncharacterized protein PV08_05144 [Exophiala spinifera]KIW17949.1 hypothetical protein PV08_05144 [Exophiala spinifera]
MPATANSGSPPVSSVSSKPPQTPSSRELVDSVVITRGHWSREGSNGQRRYFRPNSNAVHLYANMIHKTTLASFDNECINAIRLVPPDSQEYLMNLYWTQSNNILPVVDKEAFMKDRTSNQHANYSPFLHLCILATGFGYSDKGRPELKSLLMPNLSENVLERELRRLAVVEVDRPQGMRSIQALLLLGRLECMAGRENAGWLYSSLAHRLTFDFGLHLDVTGLEVSERDLQTRRIVLWACVISDRIWSLYSGRPPSIDLDEISKSVRSPFELNISSLSSLECQIYGHLVSLLSIGGKIMPRGKDDVTTDFATLMSLDQELEIWHSKLPEALKWQPSNWASAPTSLFHLHQQYHTILILLHKPFATFDSYLGGTRSGSSSSLETSLKGHCVVHCRSKCLDHAMSVSRILNKSHSRSKELPTFVTGIEHASIAAAALVASLLCMSDAKERIKPLKHLYSLIGTLHMMDSIQANAKGIAAVLQAMIDDNDWDLLLDEEEDDFHPSSLYARCRQKRSSSNSGYQEQPQAKRERVTDQTSLKTQSLQGSGPSAHAENGATLSNEMLTDPPASPPRMLGRTLSAVDNDLGTSLSSIGVSNIGITTTDIPEGSPFFFSNHESGVDFSFMQPLSWDSFCDSSFVRNMTLTAPSDGPVSMTLDGDDSTDL